MVTNTTEARSGFSDGSPNEDMVSGEGLGPRKILSTLSKFLYFRTQPARLGVPDAPTSDR